MVRRPDNIKLREGGQFGGDFDSVQTDVFSTIPGINVEFDQTVDASGQIETTFTPEHGHQHTYILLDDFYDGTNDAVDIEFRVNGDSGANYDYSTYNNISTTGASEWKLAHLVREDRAYPAGLVRISAADQTPRTAIQNVSHPGDAPTRDNAPLHYGVFNGTDPGSVTQITFRWDDAAAGPQSGKLHIYGSEVALFG